MYKEVLRTAAAPHVPPYDNEVSERPTSPWGRCPQDATLL